MQMPIAVNLIKPEPHYRHEVFSDGLQKIGYSVTRNYNFGARKKNDLLLVWNRHGYFDKMAENWEKDGGTVLVAENGYIGKDKNGHQYYALAKHGHNGSGPWTVGTPARWSKLGIDLKPWVDRPDGYVLVIGQRGIGSKKMRSPDNWHANIARELAKLTKQKIKIRQHPGFAKHQPPLEVDLGGASCVVIWSSSVGVRALTEGIPVIYDAPTWICKGAAHKYSPKSSIPTITPSEIDRLAAFQRLAHAQWSLEEIGSGEAFESLLAP